MGPTPCHFFKVKLENFIFLKRVPSNLVGSAKMLPDRYTPWPFPFMKTDRERRKKAGKHSGNVSQPFPIPRPLPKARNVLRNKVMECNRLRKSVLAPENKSIIQFCFCPEKSKSPMIPESPKAPETSKVVPKSPKCSRIAQRH